MKSYKIRLELNTAQVTLAKKHAGVARHAYNWGLSVCQNAYENKEKRPTAIDLHKKLVAEVKSVNAWYYEVSKCSPQEALRHLDRAFQRFFQKKSQYPRFKKKDKKENFYLEGAIQIKGNKIKLPRFGWVQLSEKLEAVRVKNVTVSCRAGHWFVSFKLDFEAVKTAKKEGAVGVDLGIKTLATLSNGLVFNAIKPYKKYKRKLKLAQRQASKKYQKGQKEQSKNYQKAQAKVAQIHYRIFNLRQNALHQVTSYLAKNHSEIVIEDLNVSGMSKNHRLASAILDGGFYEFRRQLAYKSQWYGSKLTIVDRFYASSKICSCCGAKKKELKLSERIFVCESCAYQADRDFNASINLRNKAVSYTASACGESNPLKDLVFEDFTKQEANSKFINV